MSSIEPIHVGMKNQPMKTLLSLFRVPHHFREMGENGHVPQNDVSGFLSFVIFDFSGSDVHGCRLNMDLLFNYTINPIIKLHIPLLPLRPIYSVSSSAEVQLQPRAINESV